MLNQKRHLDYRIDTIGTLAPTSAKTVEPRQNCNYFNDEFASIEEQLSFEEIYGKPQPRFLPANFKTEHQLYIEEFFTSINNALDFDFLSIKDIKDATKETIQENVLTLINFIKEVHNG